MDITPLPLETLLASGSSRAVRSRVTGQFSKESETLDKPVPAATKIAASTELRWINAQNLFVDEVYQRNVNHKWVRAIAREFDPDKLDPLEVSDRGNGKFAVFDGQHRLLAIREIGWGDQDVPCLIRHDLSIEEEAAAFAFQKNRKNLTRYDLHKADLAAGDELAQSIERAVQSAGYKVSNSPSTMNIQALHALYQVATKYGVQELRYTLGMLSEAWGEAPKAHAIHGTAYFLSKFPQAERDLLIGALQTETPTRFEMRTRGLREHFQNNFPVLGAYHLYGIYQKKTRTKKLPPWVIGSYESDVRGPGDRRKE